MNTYLKLGMVSLAAGMLGASLTVAYMDFYFGLDVAINSFFMVIPKSIVIGGLPSLVIGAIVLGYRKAFGKSEKGMELTCLIIGFIVGILCGPLLYISYGMF
jgi:hypothetical protein